MKLFHTAAGIFLLLGIQGMAAPDAAEKPSSPAVPAALPIERYKKMIEHSPFALATQPETPPPVVDAAGFAKDMVLTGVVRTGDNEYYVTFTSRDQAQRYSIKSGETYKGISVVSVAWSDAVGKSKVTLKRGNEFGVVGFDEAVIRNVGIGEVPNGQPAQPPGMVTPPLPPVAPGAATGPAGSPPNAAPRTPPRRFIRPPPSS